MIEALATLPAPPKPQKKNSFPLKKECYGTFRETFPERKKEECHSCWMYIDCIQISFKDNRLFRKEIGRLLDTLRQREERLSASLLRSAS